MKKLINRIIYVRMVYLEHFNFVKKNINLLNGKRLINGIILEVPMV